MDPHFLYLSSCGPANAILYCTLSLADASLFGELGSVVPT